MTINERLFKLLQEKGLKQADLAKKLGTTTSVITNWKNRGNNPPAEYLIQICEFLEITVYELLGAEEKNELVAIYGKLSPEDKAIVDIIFNKYRELDDVKLSDSKIG